MATTQNATVEVMAAVPPAIRGRIVSGMRWTFWLSVLAVPFSYGTSILLARVGPEVIGTYGLLMVYIGIVSSLFYFGGDAVVIKFVPGLRPEERLSFLATYAALVLGFVVICVGAVALWPRSLHYVFGDAGGARFQLQMLCLSPLYVLFSLVVAAHKAVLDMRWAHLLTRVLTIGSFLFYGVVYVAWRGVLAAHYVGMIWGVYLVFTTLATVIGLQHLLRLPEWSSACRRLSVLLPRSFWHYTVTTEQVSLVAFLMQRFDLILVMNLGGITTLGKYVTVLTVAESIRIANKLFVDTLLPSLTNIIAAGNLSGASQVVAMNLRLLFLVNFLGISALALCIDPITKLFGPQYVSLRALFILSILLVGLAAPGTIGGHLLSSVGKQYQVFFICSLQVALLLVLFLFSWARWDLLGAVLSVGISAVAASVALLVVGRSGASLRFDISRDYLAFLSIATTATCLSLKLRSYGTEWLVWLSAFSLFALTTRYTFAECKTLFTYFVPSFRNPSRPLRLS